MVSKFLLPNRCKAVGWFLFIPSLIFALWILITDHEWKFFDWEVLTFGKKEAGEFQLITTVQNNWTNEIAAILLLLSAFLLTFSREKNEDEYITKIRLESLQWAAMVNCAVVLAGIIFLYDFDFLYMMIINIYSLLILFIIHFHLRLNRIKKAVG